MRFDLLFAVVFKAPASSNGFNTLDIKWLRLLYQCESEFLPLSEQHHCISIGSRHIIEFVFPVFSVAFIDESQIRIQLIDHLMKLPAILKIISNGQGKRIRLRKFDMPLPQCKQCITHLFRMTCSSIVKMP